MATSAPGNNDELDGLWRALFDGDGTPRFAFTMAGHDHNVSVYGPRSRDDPEGKSVALAKGVHVIVNGAGGDGVVRQNWAGPTLKCAAVVKLLRHTATSSEHCD